MRSEFVICIDYIEDEEVIAGYPNISIVGLKWCGILHLFRYYTFCISYNLIAILLFLTFSALLGPFPCGFGFGRGIVTLGLVNVH